MNNKYHFVHLRSIKVLHAAIKMFVESQQDVQVWNVIILLGEKSCSDHC